MSKRFPYWLRLFVVAGLSTSLTVNPAMAGRILLRGLGGNCGSLPVCVPAVEVSCVPCSPCVVVDPCAIAAPCASAIVPAPASNCGCEATVDSVTPPITQVPQSDAPTSDAPLSDAHTDDAHTDDAPLSDAPSSDAPTSDLPETDSPSVVPPVVPPVVIPSERQASPFDETLESDEADVVEEAEELTDAADALEDEPAEAIEELADEAKEDDLWDDEPIVEESDDFLSDDVLTDDDPVELLDDSEDLFGDNDADSLFGDEPALNDDAPAVEDGLFNDEMLEVDPPANEADLEDLFGDPEPLIEGDVIEPGLDDLQPAPPANEIDDLFGGDVGGDDLFGGTPDAAPANDIFDAAPADDSGLFDSVPSEDSLFDEAPATDSFDDLFNFNLQEGPSDLASSEPVPSTSMPVSTHEASDSFGSVDGSAPDFDDLFGTPNELAAEEPQDATVTTDDDDFEDLFEALFKTSQTNSERPGFNGAEFRTWTDDTGSFTVQARLVTIYPDKVRILKDNGKHSTVSLDRLSQTDLAYVTWVASALTQSPATKLVSTSNTDAR